MPLPDFKTEKEFREKWIAPFLSKAGYILPKHIHGQDEQGKDFFFFDHDRFGTLRIYAVQAKLGDVKVGLDLDKLMNQADRCFRVPLKYHHGAHEQRIAAVYLMITGTFSAQAREDIHSQLRQRTYGENVICLDGQTLDNLERHATYLRDTDRRSKLAGLMSEAQWNIAACDSLIASCTASKLPQFPRFRTIALNGVLTTPLPEFNYAALSECWRLCIEFEARANTRTGPIAVNYDDVVIQSFISGAESLKRLMVQLAIHCQTKLAELDAQYNLSIEVLPMQASPTS